MQFKPTKVCSKNTDKTSEPEPKDANIYNSVISNKEEGKELKEDDIPKSNASNIQEYQFNGHRKFISDIKDLKNILEDFKLISNGEEPKREKVQRANSDQGISEPYLYGHLLKKETHLDPEHTGKRRGSADSIIDYIKTMPKKNKLFKIESDLTSLIDFPEDLSRSSHENRSPVNRYTRTNGRFEQHKIADNEEASFDHDGGESLRSDESDEFESEEGGEQPESEAEGSYSGSQESEEEEEERSDESFTPEEEYYDSEQYSSTISEGDGEGEGEEAENEENEAEENIFKIEPNKPLKNGMVDPKEIDLYLDELSDAPSIFDAAETIRKNQKAKISELKESKNKQELNKKPTGITKYKNMDIIDRFIKDLIEEYTKQDKIEYGQLYTIDEDQNKVIHLFEVL